MELTLTRQPSTDQGTPGELRGFDFEFHTLELPWRDNAPEVSCIPAGIFTGIWRESPRFGWCYEITGVPHRSHVLIHSGNYAGDRTKGFRTDVEGCILLGLSHGVLSGQRAVLRSKDAVKQFHAATVQQPFTLRVLWQCATATA